MQTKFLFTLLFISFSTLIFGQELSGKVRSEKGIGAAKVNVNFKNKSNLILTNPDGTFKIFATHLPDTLVFAADGFEPYEVVITEKNVKDPDFEVVLLEKRNTYKMDAAHDRVASISAESERETGFMRAKRKDSKSARKSAEMLAPSGFVPTSGTTMGYGASGSSLSERGAVENLNGKKFAMTDSIGAGAKTEFRSKIITAAEVNDFKKWKMWEDLSEGEFDDFSQGWGVKPFDRFCVQWQNKSGEAVIGQPVYLINKKTNETIWQAITDNTGKAELWANINLSKEQVSEFMIKADGFEINKPMTFYEGINLVKTNQSCNVPNLVEIAFVVDATGSMSDELEFLKLELEDAIRGTFEKNGQLNLRVGSVFYRDLGEAYVTRHLDFKDDLLKVLNFIKLQSAAAGGDYPEAVDSALYSALHDLHWSEGARSKILFLLSDAPPHEMAAPGIVAMLQEAAAKGIRIIPIACSGTNKSNEFLLRSMALATNGTYLTLTNHSGVGGEHIEPSTDHYEAELLYTLMQKVIEQFIFTKTCDQPIAEVEPLLDWNKSNNPLDLKVLPNPNDGQFAIDLPEGITDLYVTDFSGKILQRIEPQLGLKEVDLRGFPSAVYFVKYITKEKKWGTEKVVVQR